MPVTIDIHHLIVGAAIWILVLNIHTQEPLVCLFWVFMLVSPSDTKTR